MENADAAEETQDIFPRYAVETVWKRAVAIARPNDKSIVESIGLQIRTENYPYQQYMADAARQLLMKWETLFIEILQCTFTNKLFHLQKDKKMEYSPPPKQKGGTDHIEERIVTVRISFHSLLHIRERLLSSNSVQTILLLLEKRAFQYVLNSQMDEHLAHT